MTNHEHSSLATTLPHHTVPRYSAAHANSSAFSASANPNEDWTKVSDLAERRRIQNRIAQRNYRKKLKRRLEDLERRATSTSPSPELETRQDSNCMRRSPKPRSSPGAATAIPSVRCDQSPEPSYPLRQSEHNTFMPLPDDRYITNRSPPAFSYSSYDTTDNLSGPFAPRSPAASSYSIPSPGFPSSCSASSNGIAYLSPRTLTYTTSPSNDSIGMKHEYFDQDYSGSSGGGGYGYSHGGVGLYQESNIAYASDLDPFDLLLCQSGNHSPLEVWKYHLPESPPSFQLL